MLMTDGEIKKAMTEGRLGIERFDEEFLQPASYDMRVGDTALRSGDDSETNLASARSIVLNAGQFALLTTYERIKMPTDMAGHIGVRSYFTRKGLILLAGLQIDPGFEGSLVLGVYNASPRRLTLEHMESFCTVEFINLAMSAKNPYVSGREQQRGAIPVVDKDYLRTIETQSLSALGESVRTLSQNVGALTTVTKYIGGIVAATFVTVVAAAFAVLFTG